MLDEVRILLGILLAIIFTVVLGVGVYLSIYCSVFWFTEKQDNTICTLKVDNKEVYKGRAFYVSIGSVGENGNTKYVTIYDDTFHFHPVKQYVSEKVEVKTP